MAKEALPSLSPKDERIKRLTEEVQALQKKKAEMETAITAAENTVREEKYQSGEWERIEIPKQAGLGDVAPGLRKAVRAARGTDEIESLYRYAPDIFKVESVVQHVLQGTWNDVRKSEKFDSLFKEDVARTKKREYVLDSGDLTLGFNPDVTKKIALHQKNAMETFRKATNNRLTLQGPKAFFDTWDTPGQWKDDEGDTHGSVEDKSVREQYQDLITAHNTRFAAADEQVSDAVTTEEARDVRFKTGENMYAQVSQNLADDEFTMMSGMFRDLWIVMRNLDVSQLQNYSKRDLDVKIPMVEFFIREFKNDVEGKREMTKKNANVFSWFVNMAGQNFIPFNEIDPKLKDWYEIIKGIVGRRDARSQPSIYGRLNEYGAAGVEGKKNRNAMESAVMRRLNEYRVKAGQPLMTEETQPFGRFGIKA